MSFNPISERPRARKQAHLLHPFWTFLLLLAGIVLVSAAVAGQAAAAPGAQGAADGQAIFQARCAACHSIGGGRLVGPDLAGVTGRRADQWLRDFITDPARMIASDPEAKKLYDEYNQSTMPAMGLTPAELDAVLAYLADPGAAPAAPAAPAFQAGQGDPATGKRLFTGEAGLANGATACIACHSVRGIGALDGGALGPDLTHVVNRLGEPGLAASLNNIVYPTMAGLFANRPLTPQEQADLIAYLREANQWQAPVKNTAAGALSATALLIFALGTAGAGLLFGLMWYFWSGRKQKMANRLPIRKR